MTGGGIAAGHRHFGHAHIGFGQQGAAMLQPQVVHVAHRRHAKIAVEQPLDLAARHAEMFGAIVDRKRLFQMLLQITDRIQQAPEQLPSPGQPLIQSLRKSTIVIGRTSASGRPDLDCVTDTGVSRRQAVLTTDGIRWFLEDLGSSNGTYIGQVDRPLPTAPISGRVELGPHDRIYVGSWTRIVVRPALMQEAEL